MSEHLEAGSQRLTQHTRRQTVTTRHTEVNPVPRFVASLSEWEVACQVVPMTRVKTGVSFPHQSGVT